jgi:hypothetical protein
VRSADDYVTKRFSASTRGCRRFVPSPDADQGFDDIVDGSRRVDLVGARRSQPRFHRIEVGEDERPLARIFAAQVMAVTMAARRGVSSAPQAALVGSD